MFDAASTPKAPTAPASDFVDLLERMPPAERLRRARDAFTPHQRAAWAARYPEEVPIVNGEFEWIALSIADLD